MKTLKIVPSALLSLVVLFGAFQGAHAQTTNASSAINTGPSTVSSVVSSGPICFPFPVNIWYGASDSTTQNSVTSLQTFLAQQGDFSASNIGSGHFGPLTLRAVQEFQTANSLPSTGYVGPLTRAIIIGRCGHITPTPVTGPVSINSISPTQAPSGATVTIYGTGFTSDNTVLFDGGVAAQDVAAIYPPSTTYICPPGAFCPATTSNVTSANGVSTTNTASNVMIAPTTEMLTFTVPSSLSPYCAPDSACPMYMRLATPGQYSVTVMNSNGTSNAITFTIGSGISNTSGTLSITGLDTPSSLTMGQTGTWTVHVSAGTNVGNLNYSVDWGDNSSAPVGFMEPEAAMVSNSSTFTHAYSQSGTYTPVFTVTDSNGDSVTTSNTITVTPYYY